MAGWIKQWDIQDDHWLNSDLRYIGAWYSLIKMAETKDRKIIRNGTMIQAERGNVYTSVNELSEKWHVTRRFAKHFLDMLEQDNMISVQQADNRGCTLKVNNYAKYQDRPNNKRATDSTTDDTTDSTTHSTTDSTTEPTFFLTNNTEGIEGKKVRVCKTFTPPTQDEVRSFISSGKYPVDPVRFYEYYTARNWKGIKNWQACVRSWVARDGTKPKPNKFNNFEGREAGSNMDEYIKMLEGD